MCFQIERLIKRATATPALKSLVQQRSIENGSSVLTSVSSIQQSHLLLVSSIVAHVKEQLWQLAMDREFEVHRLELAQAAMQLQISSCSELGDIIATLERWLDNINPLRCFLVSYLTPGPIPDKRARLVYGKIGSERVIAEYDPFRSSQILPMAISEQLNQGLLVLHPAFAGDRHFGYLLLDPHGLPSIDLFRTALSIGNAMRNQFMIGETGGQC